MQGKIATVGPPGVPETTDEMRHPKGVKSPIPEASCAVTVINDPAGAGF